MGVFYGDVHYGIKISKRTEDEHSIYLDPIYELIFDDDSEEDIIDKVANVYLKLNDPHNYQYELLVDVFTTHNGISSKKGWQTISKDQMNDLIGGMYKLSRG